MLLLGVRLMQWDVYYEQKEKKNKKTENVCKKTTRNDPGFRQQQWQQAFLVLNVTMEKQNQKQGHDKTPEPI